MVVPHRFSAWGRLQLPKREGSAHQLVSARECLAHINWRCPVQFAEVVSWMRARAEEYAKIVRESGVPADELHDTDDPAALVAYDAWIEMSALAAKLEGLEISDSWLRGPRLCAGDVRPIE